MILLITWVAFLLRVNHLGSQSLWRDEVDAIRFSSWSLEQLLRGLFQTGHNGPLFFLLLRPWRYLTGDSEFALRFPSAVMGTVAIPLGFVLARQLGFSRRAGLLLGLLMATSPYLVWYGQEAKMYALLLVLITLAFIAYLKALSGARVAAVGPWKGPKGLWWLIFVVATSLSFYNHILAPLILIVFGVTAWLYRDKWRRYRQGWLVSMACLTLPYLPLGMWQVPLLLKGFQSGHPAYSLREIAALLLQLYSHGLIRFSSLATMIFFTFLLLSGLFLRGRVARSNKPHVELISVGNSSPRLLLAAWFFLPLLSVYLISLRVQVFEDRYLIYITPPFYLLVALGLIAIRRYSRRLAGLCLGLVLAINLIGVWQQQRQPIKADFRAAATYLRDNAKADSSIMVQAPYLHHTLNHYYSSDYTLLEGVWTNGEKSETAVDREMTALTAGLIDLWLVVSEEDLWDERHLTRSWLDEHAHRVDEAHFVRVALYHYRFR